MNNSLAEVHPELITEWSEKNLPLTPDDITFGSNKKYGGKVLADTNGKQALRLVPMEKNARYPLSWIAGRRGCIFLSVQRTDTGIS